MDSIQKSMVILSFIVLILTPLNATGTAGEKKDLIFAAMVLPGQNETESVIWASSIRNFGGDLSPSTIWAFVPQKVEYLSPSIRKRLVDQGVELFPFPIEENARRFPLAAKPFAAAEAEKMACGKCRFLAWIDPDNMVVGQPDECILPSGKSLGYRPVHHINIGSIYNEPLDEFWKLIYQDCRVPMDCIFPMRPNVEDIDIKPYFNAGHLVVKPERGLFKLWLDNFSRLYLKPSYRMIYKKNPRYAVFVHQAILSATILSKLSRTEILELSEKYNYPLNLYREIPKEKRIKKLNELITARYDRFTDDQHWNGIIRIDEPLKSWVKQMFLLKGVTVLALFDQKFGANNFLNRDGFEQYGWNVTTAGLSEAIAGCDFFSKPFDFPPLRPDIQFDQVINIDYFHAMAIMPASSFNQADPYREILDNPIAMDIIREAGRQGIPVSAICSGTRVLAAADVLKGRKVTGHPGYKKEFEKAGALYLGKDIPPQINGNIMTGSRDLYYNNLIVMGLATMIEERGKKGVHATKPDEGVIKSAPFPVSMEGTEWTTSFGGFGAEGARSVIQADDGGFLLAGYTFSHGSGDADILVVKTDESGNMSWSKIFGGAGTEYGNHILSTDNGYLITGYTTSFGEGSKDVYVIRTDLKGNEIWSKTYGGASWDEGMAACTSETGYLICGFTHSFGSGEEDIYLISIDPNGNELWSQSYGGRRYELGNSIYRLSDGNFIIGATTGTFGGGNSDVYLVKTDARGNKIWEKSLGGQLNTVLAEGAPTPSDWCHQIKPASDGGFLIAGTTNSRDILNALVVKTDCNGNIAWGQVLDNSTFYDYGYSVTEDKNGNVLVIGAAKSINQNNDIFLVKMNKQGELKWKKTIGSPAGSDWGRSIITTTAGEIIITGHTNSFFQGTFDVFLAKIKME